MTGCAGPNLAEAVLAAQAVAAQETCSKRWTGEQTNDFAFGQRHFREDAAATRRLQPHFALAVAHDRPSHLLLDGDLVSQAA